MSLLPYDGGINDLAGWGSKKSQKLKRIRLNSKVYFIQQGLDGPIKIGYSAYPEKRLMNIQVGNPNLLRFLLIVPGTEADEFRIHQKFKKYHLQGEWYAPDQELLCFIDSLKKNIVGIK